MGSRTPARPFCTEEAPLPRPTPAPPALPERYQPWPDPQRALLGRGGASEVWRVQDRDLGILVALKVLRTEGARLAGRLEREAVVSASVVHPNVIALHDMGRTPDGRPYLAFALASDGSMLDHAGLAPTWSDLKEQTIGLLDALGALHARGLLHLDVKLSNLLLHRIGPRNRVLWLADLGVARARWSEEEDEGMVLGTVGYMAPERLTGQHQLWGPPTDLFSVGAVLYRLLTGDLPYPAKDPVEALAARQHPPSQVPVRSEVEVPAGLEEIVLALLQPDRRARYDLAADVARAINALPDLGEGPTLGRTQAQPPRLALMAELGEDSLVEWPPPEIRLQRSATERLAGRRAGIPWNKPEPLRPPRRRPRPYYPRRVPQEPRLVSHREIPVVGRDRELDQLWSAARAVLRNRKPVMVCITSARGMGRTRLVDELTRTLERVGIAQGVRIDYSGPSGPTQGLEGALHRLLPPLPDARAHRNDIARTLSRLRNVSAASCRHDAAALAEWIAPHPTAPRATAPRSDRSVARSFLVEHLSASAWRGLTWLWLDDLHLAGETDDAWAVVDMLFASRVPTLVLCSAVEDASFRMTMRPLRRLEARYPKRCWRIRLGPLGDEDARKLARAHLPMDEDLAGELAAKTRGHPRFMHDLVVHMIRQGALVPGPKDPSGTPLWTHAADAAPLPADRHEFARQRLALALQADPDLRHALLAVRLAGTGAPEHVVARVAGEALDRTITQSLVRVEQEGLVIDSPELKQAITEMERPSDLDVTTHENLAAAWLEEGDDPLAEARAGLHLALAGRQDEALPLLRRALSRLEGTLRPLPLSRLARRTMELAQAAGPGGQTAWVEAALVRSQALWELGKDTDALALDERVAHAGLSPDMAIEAACLHARHLGPGDGDRSGLDRLAEVEQELPRVLPPVQARFYATRAGLHVQRLDRDAALADVAAALDQQPEPDVRARCLLLQAELIARAEPRRALAIARQVQDLARQHGQLQPEIDAWDLVGRLAVREGRVEQAVAELEAGVVRLRRVGERAAAGHLLSTLGTIHRDAGDLERSRTAYLDALSLEATGREGFSRRARIGLAMLAAVTGNGARIRLLGESAGAPVEPAEIRLWSLLKSVGSLLEGGDPALPDIEILEQAALSDTDGLFLAELLIMKMIDRSHPQAEAIQERLRSLAARHDIDRRLVDEMLVRAAMS